jgi:Kinesin-like protein
MTLFSPLFSSQLSGLDSIIHGDNGPKTKQFSFNVVFEPRASQPDVFLYSGMTRLVQMAIEGFSTTCFCYGQTGSGKTHTLTGPPGMVSVDTALEANFFF